MMFTLSPWGLWLRLSLVFAVLGSVLGPLPVAAYAPANQGRAARESVGVKELVTQIRAGAQATPVRVALPTTPTVPLAAICSTPNAIIPDGGRLTSTLSVTQTGTLTDLNIVLSATHSAVGDLVFTLTHGTSSGSLLALPMDIDGRPCDSNDLSSITLDSDGSGFPGTSVQSSCASGDLNAAFVFGGTYLPNQSLNIFDGHSLSGFWTLTVQDATSSDTGVLQQWCLVPTTAAVAAPIISVTPTELSQTQAPNAIQTRTLTIANVGTSSLSWSSYEDSLAPYCDAVSAIPWVSMTPLSGTVNSGAATNASVIFNATNLTYSTYTGALCLASNDSTSDLVVVPLTLNVAALNPAIVLTKTVGTTPNTCATTNTISVFSPANVTYCYRVRNTGNVTLTTHTLWDSRLGTLSNSVPMTLTPGGIITVLQATTLATAGVIMNTAVWTATNGLATASASSVATVTVTAPSPAIVLTKTVGLTPGQCAPTASITVLGQTSVIYCYTVRNTGNVTLTNHSLFDMPLGNIPVTSPYTLGPGAAISVLFSATIATTTTNTALWTASNGTYTPTASANATVNVIPANPAIALTKTVQLGAGCAAATQAIATTTYGAAATYCFRVSNTGNYTLTSHTLRDGHLGTISNTVPFTLAPGAIITVQQSFTIAQSITSTAVWTATRSIYSAVDSDTTQVTLFNTPTMAYAATSYNLTLNAGAAANRAFYITNTQVGSMLTWSFTEAYGNAPTPDGDTPSTASLAPATVFTLAEDFNDVNMLVGLGWVSQNQSQPLGSTDWEQGNPASFPAQAGASQAYIDANFNNTAGLGTISNWLFTPELALQNGATFSFYTRVPTNTGTVYPDRMEVRLSTSGASTNVGTTAFSVGVFTRTLLTINPNLTPTGYPATWTLYTVVLTNVAAPTTGRIAFRYYVTNAGSQGTNSNYAGLDTVRYTQPNANCASPANMPWLTVTPSSGGLAGGNSVTPTLNFNANGLTPGSIFTGKLCLATNDLARPLSIIPVTLTIAANGGFSVTATPPTQSSDVGTSVTYTVRLTNTSTSAETYDIGLSNTPLFTTTFPSSVGPVAAGGSANVVVTVTVPSDLTALDTSIAVLQFTARASTINRTVTLFTTGTGYLIYIPIIKK